MSNVELTLYHPLARLSKDEHEELCKVLWGWTSCRECSFRQECSAPDCPWQHLERLSPYICFYEEITSCYVPEELMGDSPALRSHLDLLEIVKLLREKPRIPRSQLIEEYFSNARHQDNPDKIDKYRAFDLAISVLTMADFPNANYTPEFLENGPESGWNDYQSVKEFMVSEFPKRSVPSEFSLDMYTHIRAKQLKATAHLRFEGTNNLRQHLLLDKERGIVKVFHHSTFLKESLKASQKSCSEIIPRQLAFETLESIQILFPFDVESRKLLRSLVSKDRWDPDCLNFDSKTYRHPSETYPPHCYWHARLMDLYEEYQNPHARGQVQQWVAMNCKDRHLMLATLAGIFIAITIGILGLVVAIIQVWISYQTWKHPVG